MSTKRLREESSWCTIESDPGIFTLLIEKLGVKGVQVEEIYDLESVNLESVFGYIFLFKWAAKGAAEGDGKEVETSKIDENVFFAQQEISNACATQAILHILLNSSGVELGTVLDNFKSFSKDLPPDMRGLCLSNSLEIREISNEFGNLNELLAFGDDDEDDPEKESKLKEPFHFVAFIYKNGNVYELDGLKEAPVVFEGDENDWQGKVLEIIKRRVNSGEIRFNLMALCRDQREILKEKIDKLNKQINENENETEKEQRTLWLTERFQAQQELEEEEAKWLRFRKDWSERQKRYKESSVSRQPKMDFKISPQVQDLLKSMSLKGEAYVVVATRETNSMTVEEYRRLREKGKELLTGGNSSKAVEYYTRALKIALRLLQFEPNKYSAQFTPQNVRTTCLNLPEHDGRTCEFCSKYLDLAVCYSNRSLARCNLKEYEKALLDSEEVIKLAPEWPKGYYRKAEALLGMGQFEICKLFYEQVIGLEPIGSSSIDLLKMKILNADLLEEARGSGLYFRPLIPGEHICLKTWNPLSKIVFEFAKKMKNVVYVIGDLETKECVVVDPCWDVEGILREVCEVDGMKIVGILATHNHFDHVGGRPPAPFDSYGVNVNGAAKILEKFPEISIRIHRDDVDVLVSEAFVPRDRIIPTENGDELRIGRHEIKFIHTPGHTPGSQCILFGPGKRRVLTGDTLFCGSCGRVDFPGGNVHELYNSLFRLIDSWPEEIAIFPAHSYGGRLMTSLWYERLHGILRFKRKQDFASRLGVHVNEN